MKARHRRGGTRTRLALAVDRCYEAAMSDRERAASEDAMADAIADGTMFVPESLRASRVAEHRRNAERLRWRAALKREPRAPRTVTLAEALAADRVFSDPALDHEVFEAHAEAYFLAPTSTADVRPVTAAPAPMRARSRERRARCRSASKASGSDDDGGGSDEPPAGTLHALPARPSVPPALDALAHGLTGPERLAAFLALPEPEQAALMAALADYWHARREGAA